MEDFIGIARREAAQPSQDENFARCSDFGRDKFAFAMSYVPKQRLNRMYSEDVALERGTLFPELDKPFLCAK